MTAEDWARAECPGAVITFLRTRPWADVWRVDGIDGRWWLKVNKERTVYEPRLLGVLAGTGSALVPDPPGRVVRFSARYGTLRT